MFVKIAGVIFAVLITCIIGLGISLKISHSKIERIENNQKVIELQVESYKTALDNLTKSLEEINKVTTEMQDNRKERDSSNQQIAKDMVEVSKGGVSVDKIKEQVNNSFKTHNSKLVEATR